MADKYDIKGVWRAVENAKAGKVNLMMLLEHGGAPGMGSLSVTGPGIKPATDGKGELLPSPFPKE